MSPKVEIATPPDMNPELSYGEVFDAFIQIEDSNRGCEEEYEILREPIFEKEALPDELSVEMKLEPVSLHESHICSGIYTKMSMLSLIGDPES